MTYAAFQTRESYEAALATARREGARSAAAELAALRRVAEAAWEVVAFDPGRLEGSAWSEPLIEPLADLRAALTALHSKEGA